MRAFDKLPLDLLSEETEFEKSPDDIAEEANKLLDVLQAFRICAELVDVSFSSAAVSYAVKLKPGTRVSKIKGIQPDIEVNLGKKIQLDIGNEPGVLIIRAIEINRPAIGLRSLLSHPGPDVQNMKIPVAAGVDESGNNLYFDIPKLPHLIISGSTGSGKTVFINDIILSILYSCKPSDVEIIMIDLKGLEYRCYNNVPHFPVPVITESRTASKFLEKAESIMRDRYAEFADAGVRNISEYNKHFPEKRLPHIVIIIDEYSELMYYEDGLAEEIIESLSRMSRAAGFSLIIATQRPSSNMISREIQMNIPARITFSLSNWHESLMMLGQTGAEKLMGNGDMYYRPADSPRLIHAQAPFVSESEIQRVSNYFKGV